MTFQEMRAALDQALESGPRDQQHLVATVDAAWAWIEEHPEGGEEAITDLRVRIAHAESLIGRYFGM
jgi:ABC-type nitrate/sulfonate/bicarbonate transport system substrate-binding protein